MGSRSDASRARRATGQPVPRPPATCPGRRRERDTIRRSAVHRASRLAWRDWPAPRPGRGSTRTPRTRSSGARTAGVAGGSVPRQHVDGVTEWPSRDHRRSWRAPATRSRSSTSTAPPRQPLRLASTRGPFGSRPFGPPASRQPRQRVDLGERERLGAPGGSMPAASAATRISRRGGRGGGERVPRSCAAARTRRDPRKSPSSATGTRGERRTSRWITAESTLGGGRNAPGGTRSATRTSQ